MQQTIMARLVLLCAAAALLALGGCATFNRIDSEVSVYSQWPVDRKPSTYAFERLPSQQAHLERQQLLERSARPAIEGAGFVAAGEGTADVMIQLGARITATDADPFDAPLGWGGYRYPGGWRWARPMFRGGWGYGPGYGWGYGWGPGFDTLRYEREVALLMRDRKTGQPLYETHATSQGLSPQPDVSLPAMFQAAMRDFPHSDPQPHRVSVDIAP